MIILVIEVLFCLEQSIPTCCKHNTCDWHIPSLCHDIYASKIKGEG